MKKVNIGDLFGCMTVKSIEGSKAIVSCNCGLTKEVLKVNLTTGRTKSLGCLKNKFHDFKVVPITLNDKLLDRYNDLCLQLGFPQIGSLPPTDQKDIPHWILVNVFFFKPANFKPIFNRGSLGKDYKGYPDLIRYLLDNQPDTSNDVLLDKLYLVRNRIVKRLLS
jgi:hypothetical protein